MFRVGSVAVCKLCGTHYRGTGFDRELPLACSQCEEKFSVEAFRAHGRGGDGQLALRQALADKAMNPDSGTLETR